MHIELYVCEGALKDTTLIYTPEFTHHEHDDLSVPRSETWTTMLELKQQGFTLLKEVDLTKQHNINDTDEPIKRSLLVFGSDD